MSNICMQSIALNQKSACGQNMYGACQQQASLATAGMCSAHVALAVNIVTAITPILVHMLML